MLVIKQYPQQYQGLLRVERRNNKIDVFMVGSKEIMQTWNLVDNVWIGEVEIPDEFMERYRLFLDNLGK